MIEALMYGMMPSAKIVALLEVAAHEQVVEPEERVPPPALRSSWSARRR